ncbi:MAG TPA: NAD(P)-dependent oxidoreductase [Gaiellaceae bacterium]|nr:NAD(P)-dependent oxidoreductase [Gaiellaceae bacterium]
MTAVAFVGLGAMGERMARRLLDAGHELSVWNRTPAKAEALVAAGARRAASAADAARSAEVAVTTVSDPAALEAVTAGPYGVLAGLEPGSLLIEMSTVGPAALHDLAEKMPEGTTLLDAPVLGSISEAEEGTLRIFVGGDEDGFARVAPLLVALGEPILVGPPGSGAAAKLVANSTLLGVLSLLGEALALGERLGLETEVVFDVLASTPLGAQAKRRRPAVQEGRYPRRFALGLAAKDGDLVVEDAGRVSLDLRLASAARDWFRSAESEGWGELDYSAILAFIGGKKRPGS